ncbi:response regulator transcription factor [Thalassospiraceae bacterium LMO-JJ14]|nr:response regulator transcription factor [Thalassospiraceae bacterium LMO-JJ14]
MADSAHILVVEDDTFVQKALRLYLEGEGYRISTCDNGSDMHALMAKDPADLAIMDLKLPNDDGFDLTKQLREKYAVGIIILTSKDDAIDRVVGLEIGADDYVTKPWDERELLARIRSVMRRVTERRKTAAIPLDGEQRHVSFNGWVLNLDSRELKNPDGEKIELTSGEFSLLNEFIEKAGRVLSRDHLLSAIYSRDWEPFDRSIDVLVTRLRRKVEQDSRHPEIIKTVRGTGYMFAAAIKRAD